MGKVTHRNMQKHGLGIETPIKDRKCQSCNEIFKSKQGLTSHQSRKKNVNCFRAGLHGLRKDCLADKLKNQKDCNKRKFENHPALDEKHRKGQAFSAAHKQSCLNLYQRLRNEGCTKASSIGKVLNVL